jgi:hypothetical protein
MHNPRGVRGFQGFRDQDCIATDWVAGRAFLPSKPANVLPATHSRAMKSIPSI